MAMHIDSGDVKALPVLPYPTVRAQLRLKGTRWFFDHVQNAEYPRPADTIATYQLHITQRSEWSPESRDWRELWRAEAISPSEVEQVIKKFGKPTEYTLFFSHGATNLVGEVSLIR